MQIGSLLLASTATLIASGVARAQFADGLDNSSADVLVIAETDSSAQFVDYSNMTLGSQTFSIPEAPRRIPGSAATRGIVCQANQTLGVASAVNIIAGATPISFSGRHRLSFDVYINVPDPLPGGSTEQVLWGVGTDNVAPIEARHNRNSNTIGVWGWLAGENGYSTDDAVIFQDGTELADWGDTQPGEDVPFNEAFNKPVVAAAPNNAAANQWVRVDIDVDTNGDVRVYYNGVEFFNQTGLSPSGFAMMGYEDPFNSLNTNPDAQWCLLDNFRVSLGDPACPIPGAATIQGTATGGEILNGSAIPAAGSPMTARLRGGPASAGALLAMGFPAPATIPVPLGSCTLGVEVVIPTLASILTITDALGNSEFTVNVPPGGAFCARSFGFQFFWVDATPCGVAHTEGMTLSIGG
ncbi:MAG: hypothetical protein NXI31_12395 [bacterium]|nr:hypothetical protein [bacterium]